MNGILTRQKLVVLCYLLHNTILKSQKKEFVNHPNSKRYQTTNIQTINFLEQQQIFVHCRSLQKHKDPQLLF